MSALTLSFMFGPLVVLFIWYIYQNFKINADQQREMREREKAAKDAEDEKKVREAVRQSRLVVRSEQPDRSYVVHRSDSIPRYATFSGVEDRTPEQLRAEQIQEEAIQQLVTQHLQGVSWPFIGEKKSKEEPTPEVETPRERRLDFSL